VCAYLSVNEEYVFMYRCMQFVSMCAVHYFPGRPILVKTVLNKYIVLVMTQSSIFKQNKLIQIMYNLNNVFCRLVKID